MPLKEITTEDIVLVILAIILPPLAVFLRYNLRFEFWLSLILTIIGWVPGIVYAIFVILWSRASAVPTTNAPIV
ncbi:hypothetical protein BDF19DRAFT_423418 [Syncephalis fuscata]|nr:hypothetical protein BDF19DRAFT_423418 [Syncephalis fuscata]